MKLRLICPHCISESEEREIYLPGDLSKFELMYAEEVNDDGIYKIICNKGHETRVILQEQKFEILFDLGAMALLDGYTRESVSSLAASLERFYEFCIEIILAHNNIDYDDYIKTWEYVRNQSERQLGAFYLLYLLEFKEPPKRIAKKYINLRNRVIHKGYIPKYDEAIDYGEHILAYMFDILKKFRTENNDSLQKVIIRRSGRLARLNNDLNDNPTFMQIPTIIHLALSDDDFGKDNFSDSLDKLKRYRNRNYTTK